MQSLNSTAHKILDVAEDYTQTKGFNGFSYRDIQAEVGIKTSSIHYYFATKHDLAVAMITRYTENFKQSLQDIEDNNDGSAKKELEAFSNRFITLKEEGKFCICGMLCSDLMALPESAHSLLHNFFNFTEQWITGVIEKGVANGEFKTQTSPKLAASAFLATLEGAMLVARPESNIDKMTALVSFTHQQLAA